MKFKSGTIIIHKVTKSRYKIIDYNSIMNSYTVLSLQTNQICEVTHKLFTQPIYSVEKKSKLPSWF